MLNDMAKGFKILTNFHSILLALIDIKSIDEHKQWTIKKISKSDIFTTADENTDEAVHIWK